MSSYKCFAVVCFPDNSMTVIPTSWMFSGKTHEKGDKYCYWPNSNEMAKVKRCEPPNKEKWTVHKIRVFSYAESHDSAMRKCNIGIDTSTIETDSESDNEIVEKRQPKKPRRYLESEDHSNDSTICQKSSKKSCELPQPPQVIQTPKSRFSTVNMEGSAHPVSYANVSVHENSGRRSPLHVDSISPVSFRSISSSPSTRGFVRSSMSPANSPVFEQLPHHSYNIQSEHSLPHLTVPRRRNEHGMTEKLVAEVNGIRATQQELVSNQVEILSLLRQLIAGKFSNDVVVEDIISKPCESKEEFENLNQSLENGDFRKKLVALLGTLAGGKLGETVRKMMRALGTNQLWSLYSLKGKRDKLSFEALPLCRVVIKACLKVHKAAKVTEVEECLSETLKHAPTQKDGPKYKQRCYKPREGQQDRPQIVDTDSD